MSEEKIIPFEEKQIADFKEHLEKPNNHKILFSAKFGEGKTTFLKDFFEKNKDRYEVFHLYPVNYQILSNEDIFDLLKYDILIELLNKDKQRIEKLKKDGIKLKSDNKLFKLIEKNYFSFIRENFSLNLLAKKGIGYVEEIGNIKASFLKSSAELDFGLGKMLGRGLKDLLEFDEKFQEWKKGDEGRLEKFIQKVKQRVTTETDIFSQIIKEKVERIKTLNNKKQSILILDDLDRMDPEHIFRILNIFSAYFEKTTEEGKSENKFGFDKIILVAHYGNLKEMFKHRYGEKVDKKGYFNKFYSKNVHRFDNKIIVVNAVEEMMRILKVENDPEIRYIFNFFLVRILINNLFELNKDKKLDIRIFKNAFDTELKHALTDLTEKDYFYYINLCLRIMENVFIQFEKTQNLNGKEIIIDDNDNLIRKMKDKNIKIDVVNEDGSEMIGILNLIRQFSLKGYSYNNPKNNNFAHKNQDAIRKMRIDDLREILSKYLIDKRHLVNQK